ncbi:MAG: SMP-30/gluconolactonase/LRE family protein [candidate division WOR-3 bacterium]|nr:MAG: SMP-30/gluconolactonase/LRE family protein [candidate division WOR-3 bacterium]
MHAQKVFLVFCLVLHTSATADTRVIDFGSDRWVTDNARIVEHLGRQSLLGFAYLRDVEFDNGIIEVDIAVTGQKVRAYPGIIFRMQSDDDYERFYVRTHRANLYADALQYAPITNGITGWQLYNGNGFTAGVDFPSDQWVHVKMEILGKQALVYVGDMERPALVINELMHGASKGAIGIMAEGTAYFSNFKYTITDDLKFEPPPLVDTLPGIITDWQLSQPFKLTEVDMQQYPDKRILSGIEWQDAKSTPSGLVDIGRYAGRLGQEPDCILARKIIYTDKDRMLHLSFGYSDAVSIFLNGERYFLGNSAYQSRDPSFLGIIGYFDEVSLPLRKGRNELLLIVAEVFGGWGFMARDGDAVLEYEGLVKCCETEREFRVPESAVYDPERDILYVSNYDVYNPSRNDGGQSISRVSLDGTVENLDWATGLKNPLGMIMNEDRLFVAERGGIAVIALQSGEIINRYPIDQAGLLNDIAIDANGSIYVSDSRKNIIYKLSNGEYEEWLSGDEVDDPNGMLINENSLIFGNSGDHYLKSVDLTTKEISKIANLNPGFIDGIKLAEDGNYLVSHWQGRVFRIAPSGAVTKILDLSAPGIYCADFEYIPDKDLLIIPTFFDNRLIIYRFKEEQQ